jgi:hypothetical protein
MLPSHGESPELDTVQYDTLTSGECKDPWLYDATDGPASPIPLGFHGRRLEIYRLFASQPAANYFSTDDSTPSMD